MGDVLPSTLHPLLSTLYPPPSTLCPQPVQQQRAPGFSKRACSCAAMKLSRLSGVTLGMACAHVREVVVVVRRADDAPNDRSRHGRASAVERSHHLSLPPRRRAAGTAPPYDVAGFRPRSTAVHSRKLSARITTTEIMKNAATAASR